jgi:Trm5-related predicted tRNA methylase
VTPSTAQRTAIRRLKASAVVCLGLLLLFIISQLLSIYQTRRELVSPLIPKLIIDEVNQQYLFHAVVSSVMLVIAVALYLLRRYWWAILLVAITLVGNRYLYW